jgi:hypothetical protein
MWKWTSSRRPSGKLVKTTVTSSRPYITRRKNRSQREKPTGVAMLLCQRSVSNKISRLLNKYDIQTVHTPARKNM